MAGQDINDFESAALEKLRREHRVELDKRDAQIRTLRGAVKNLEKDRTELFGSVQALRDLTYPTPSVTTPPSGKRDDIVRIIIPDVHGASMDQAAVAALLADIKTLDPDEVVIMGDLVECGGFLAKHHTLGYLAQTEYTYEQDIAQANWLLDEIAKAAPKALIEWVEGNHDARPERWAIDATSSDGRDAEFLYQIVAPSSLLKVKERGIPYYRRATIYNVPGRAGWVKKGKIFFTHELKGGRNAAMGSLAATAGNICFAHTHKEDTATLNLPGVGLVKAFNAGCLCRIQPLWCHTDPTNWSHGYGIQFVAKSEEFLNIHVPIINGESLLGNLAAKVK